MRPSATGASRRPPRWLTAIAGGLALALLLPADAAARRPLTGELVIECSTKGATVYIDGNEVGSIPLGRAIKLKPGPHAVKVVKPGYTKFIESVTIQRGKTKRLELDLFPISAILRLSSSEPGARVYLDGKFVGKTPLSGPIDLKPGKHTVRLARVGFYDVIRKLDVKAGKRVDLRATLKPLPAHLNPLIPKEPKKKVYEKWWFWVAAAGGLVALVTIIAVPAAVTGKDRVRDFGADREFTVP